VKGGQVSDRVDGRMDGGGVGRLDGWVDGWMDTEARRYALPSAACAPQRGNRASVNCFLIRTGPMAFLHSVTSRVGSNQP
jgi:hypothetical protein